MSVCTYCCGPAKVVYEMKQPDKEIILCWGCFTRQVRATTEPGGVALYRPIRKWWEFWKRGDKQ